MGFFPTIFPIKDMNDNNGKMVIILINDTMDFYN